MRKKGDNLTEKQVAELLTFCTHKPGQKKALITEGYRQLGLQQNPTLADWGLKVDPQLSRVDGRVLDPPKLSAKQSNMKTNAILTPYNGTYDLRSKAFLRPAQLTKWGVIVSTISVEAVRLNAKPMSRSTTTNREEDPETHSHARMPKLLSVTSSVPLRNAGSAALRPNLRSSMPDNRQKSKPTLNRFALH